MIKQKLKSKAINCSLAICTLLILSGCASAAVTENINIDDGWKAIISNDYASGLCTHPNNIFIANTSIVANDTTVMVWNSSNMTLSGREPDDDNLFIGQLYPATHTKYRIQVNITKNNITDGTNNPNLYLVQGALFKIGIYKYPTYYRMYMNTYDANGSLTNPSVKLGDPGYADVTFEYYPNETVRMWNTSDPSTYLEARYHNDKHTPYVASTGNFIRVYPGGLGNGSSFKILKFEQSIPKKLITFEPSNNKLAYGFDGPRRNYKDGKDWLVAHNATATLWLDPGYITDENREELQDLIQNKNWELGAHFSEKLTTLSAEDAINLMNTEYTDFETIYGKHVVTWCSLGNGGNESQVNYMYEHLGSVHRNSQVACSGSGAGIEYMYGASTVSTASNIKFWDAASAHGTIHPVYEHSVIDPLQEANSISYTDFNRIMTNYTNAGIKIIPMGQWWYEVTNQNQTIRNIHFDKDNSYFNTDTRGYISNYTIYDPNNAGIWYAEDASVSTTLSGANVTKLTVVTSGEKTIQKLSDIITSTSGEVTFTPIAWNNTSKIWKESSSTQNTATQHIIGGFQANTPVQIIRDGINYTTVTSNNAGYIDWTYADEYGEREFEIYAIPLSVQPVLPVANFTSNTTEGYAPLTVQFNDNSENATSVSWDFDDDGVSDSDDRNPVYKFTTPGIYTVNITAINGNGTDSKLATTTVLEEPLSVLPVANFSSNVSEGCAPLSVQFTDLSEKATGVSWDFDNNGVVDSTNQNPVNVYTTQGIYTVNLTAANVNGTNSKLAIISVSENSECASAENITFTTTGAKFQPEIKVTGTPEILWTFSDGTTSTSLCPSVNFGTTGTRNQTLKVTPWNALYLIDLGYSGADGGVTPSNGTIPSKTNQYVSTINGLENVNLSLVTFAACDNPIKSLDFSNFTNLTTIECFSSDFLSNITLKNVPNLKRICVQGCNLSIIDLSDVPNLADLRAAKQNNGALTMIYWPETIKAWHICVHSNPNFTGIIPINNCSELTETYVHDMQQTGEIHLCTQKLELLDARNNSYKSANLSGCCHTTGNILLSNNKLTSLDISNCTGIYRLLVGNNSLNQPTVDGVLQELDLYGNETGTVNLTYNSVPSIVGIQHAANLANRSWTVKIDPIKNVYLLNSTMRVYPAGTATTWTIANVCNNINNAVSATIIPSSNHVNVTVKKWNDSIKIWSESCGTSNITTRHIIGDFPANTHIQILRDGIDYAIVTSNDTGYIDWTYAGEYGEHEFEATIPLPLQPVVPVANFTSNTTEGHAPLTVQFTDLSENADSVAWDFNGDGNADSDDRNPVYEFTIPGNYTVNLTAINSDGSSDEKSMVITVNRVLNPLISDFTANETEGYAPLSVQFTDTSTGLPTSWEWNFGDGSPNSNEQNPNHTYSLAGTYTVILNASNATGHSINMQTNYITVLNNSNIGSLTLVNTDFSQLSSIPRGMYIEATAASAPSNVILTYNNTLKCADIVYEKPASGSLFVTNLYPTTDSNMTYTLGTEGVSVSSYVNVMASNSRIAVFKKANGDYKLTSYWTGDDADTHPSFITVPAASIKDNKVTFSVVSYESNRTNMLKYNDTIYTKTPFITMKTRNQNYVFVNQPMVHFSSYIANNDNGPYVLHLYSIKQEIPRKIITSYGNRSISAFTITYPDSENNGNGINLMKSNGQKSTIYVDIENLDPAKVAYEKALLDEGWEMGIHYTVDFGTVSNETAIDTMDSEYTTIVNTFGRQPKTWCAQGNSGNISQAMYAYQRYGMIWRSCESGALWLKVGNLGNSYWRWWNTSIPQGVIFPAYTITTDKEPVSGSSINASYFTMFSNGFAANNIRLCGLYEYYFTQSAQNTTQVNITDSNNSYMRFTVNTSGYPCTLNVMTNVSNIEINHDGVNVPYTSVDDGVIFTATDNTTYELHSVSNTTRSIPAITWRKPAAITYGTALSDTQLNANASVPGSFVYNPVSGTILGAGTQTLQTTFAPTDSTNYTTATSSVSLTVNKATPLITWSKPSSIGYGTVLSGTQLNASTSVPGSFVYTPASGTIPSAGNHALQVMFTPTDTKNYTTASSSVLLTVNKATPLITWSKPANITYGTPLSETQLDASSSVPGSFVYTPASGTVLSSGTHTLHVDFTSADDANYNNATADVTINVLEITRATPTITWSNPAAIIYGTALSDTQLNANASVPGSFIYNPVSGSTLGVGTQTLQTTFTPTDSTNYTTATSSVSLTVNKATPLITWSKPADITYGTSLSETQLNASASVPGSFVYTPASGTVLDMGTQTLQVAFTPSDATNYTTASSSVSINVANNAPVESSSANRKYSQTNQKILEPKHTQLLNSSEDIGKEVESKPGNDMIGEYNILNKGLQTEQKENQRISGFEIYCGVVCLLGIFLYKRK
ncbi:MAG TPA: PKD domain-containing protein [Methanosarcina sp.]|nr:PKD domain-containing protein [Methanosarcina sp.]